MESAATVRPSGLNGTLKTQTEWPSIVAAQGHMTTTQSCTVLSIGPILATVRPSGLKGTLKTQTEWPSSVAAQAHMAMPQSCAALSIGPMATALLSGLNATLKTQPEWTSRVAAQPPTATSQSQAALSIGLENQSFNARSLNQDVRRHAAIQGRRPLNCAAAAIDEDSRCGLVEQVVEGSVGE